MFIPSASYQGAFICYVSLCPLHILLAQLVKQSQIEPPDAVSFSGFPVKDAVCWQKLPTLDKSKVNNGENGMGK